MLPYYGLSSSYIYSITTDFGGIVDIVCLDLQIRESALPALILVGVFIEEGNDELLVHFTRDLTSGEEITLDTVVANHDPDCSIGNEQTDMLILNPSDGDSLAFDSTSGLWINKAPEVDVSTPTSFWASLNADGIQNRGESSTTNNTFQIKTSIVIPGIAGSRFRVGYGMEFNASNNNKAVEVDLYNVYDDISVATNRQQTNSSANWFTFSGFHYEVMDTNAKTFQLRYRDVTGTTCSVKNAVIEIWRVE